MRKDKMPTNSMLLIRPDYELVTRYAASWITQVLNAATIPVVDLYGSEATSINFFNALETQDPLIVNILGHGDYNLIACQNSEVLLQGGVNTNILVERVVYDLSCRAGRDLGRTAFAEGAISFLGYTEDFWMCYSTGDHSDGGMVNPLQDLTSQGFFESHNIAPISYLQGSTVSDSYYASQNKFNYWINVWEQIDSQVAALLVWNRDYQILYGEGAPVPGAGIGPALLMLAPLLFIPMLSKKKKLK